MKVLRLVEVDIEAFDIFEVDGMKFAVTNDGEIYHYESGIGWDQNGRFDNAKKAERVFIKKWSLVPAKKKKAHCEFLKKQENIND